MKKIIFVGSIVVALTSCSSVKKEEKVKKTPKYIADIIQKEETEKHNERIGWWREARFGCFIHWGVYSELGGIWKGKPVKGYAEHIQRICKINQEEYRKEVVEKFNPVKFDADAWVKTIKDAGMKYLIITAKHHDGFAMFDSQANDYNIVKATPFHRDPMKELKLACDHYGIRFGFYYSHAFDWGEKDGVGNDWEWKNPGGDKHFYGGSRWWKKHPEKMQAVHDSYIVNKCMPQIRELLLNYHPDIIWFDTPGKISPKENEQLLAFVRKTAPWVVVNGRLVRKPFTEGGGDYQNTCDRPAEFYPVDGDWEAIPTTNESYGYHKMDKSHKSVEHFVKLLSKSAARGGNLLLNIGPRGDGTIDPPDLKILRGIGAWMKVNGEAIYGTRRTTLPVQAWGQSTMKGNTIYLHIHDFPKNNVLILGGLKSPVKKVWALSDTNKTALVIGVQKGNDIGIWVPKKLSKELVPVLVVESAGEIKTDPIRLISPTQVNRFHVFDGIRKGSKLRYGAGKARDSYVKNWSKKSDYMLWKNRITAPALFEVYIEYDADKNAGQNLYIVKVGKKTFQEKVLPNVVRKKIFLGTVQLKPGENDITVKAVELASKNLFNLRAVTLKPIEK